MSPIAEVKDFSCKYRDTKRRAVKHVDFQVEEGSFFTIIGANGAGKSTLCNALVGLIPHYFVGAGAGHILIDGTDVADSTIAELSKTIGLVFQNPFNQLSYTAGTVAEELAYGLGNHGVPRAQMIDRVEAVAKLMRIDHILDKNPLELSGGQVQRVAFGSTRRFSTSSNSSMRTASPSSWSTMTWSEWHDTRIPSWCSSEAKSWPLALRWRCSPIRRSKSMAWKCPIT